jgi:hypothetical protein
MTRYAPIFLLRDLNLMITNIALCRDGASMLLKSDRKVLSIQILLILPQQPFEASLVYLPYQIGSTSAACKFPQFLTWPTDNKSVEAKAQLVVCDITFQRYQDVYRARKFSGVVPCRTPCCVCYDVSVRELNNSLKRHLTASTDSRQR